MSSTNLSVEQRARGGELVIAARGEVDRSTAATLSDALRDAAYAPKGSITVDVSRATFSDSSGISVLVNGLRRLRCRGRRMSLVCTRGEVSRILQRAGLGRVLDIRTAREGPA